MCTSFLYFLIKDFQKPCSKCCNSVQYYKNNGLEFDSNSPIELPIITVEVHNAYE